MRIHDHLDHWADVQPTGLAVDDGDRSVTWDELRQRSYRMARALAVSCQPGDRVAVLAKNSLDFLALYYGSFRVGVVLVPLNFRMIAPEWRYIAADAGVRRVLVDREMADAMAPVTEELGIPCSVLGGDFEAEVQAQPAEPPDVEVDPSWDAYQMYTSGTTGRPKGAVLTHQSVVDNVTQMIVATGLHRSQAMVVMPLFHAGAAVSAFAFVATGTAMSLVREFDPAEVVRRLRSERCSAVTFVPAMIQMLLAVPEARDEPWPDLQLVCYGAAPIASDVLRTAMDVFACDFLQGFGMTELSALATVLSPDDHRLSLAGRPELLLSAGRPVLATRLRIVDEDGQELPAGEVGEVLVRGPQVMRCYWNLPEATAAAVVEGWMHTGDAGRVDADGYLFLSDRITDMVVSGGENVYPREVEDVLFALDGVVDAAVIGVPDERWGEAVKAVVVLGPGADLDDAAVLAHCRANLGGYKCPTSIDFVDALPRNATGKVLKRELRAPYWEGHARSLSRPG